MNDDLNFNYNDFSKRTPNRNISISRFGTPLNYSNEPFPNSILNESNGVKLTNIVDESVLKTKFEAQENSIRSVCGYYISLKDIFKDADIEIKNKLLQYVTEFNNSCKTFLDKKTNKKVMVVSSTEVPIRKDVLASMMFVPATAGILCAKYIVNDIIMN